jgi:CRP/FNR family transcriptional regulator, cyclic AMP receptor protein
MIPKEFIDMARAYRVLSDLQPAQLRKLLPLAEEKYFGAGTIIFREGEKSGFLHLIVSGEVAIERRFDDFTARIQTLGPGDAMGWSALTEDCRTHFQTCAIGGVSTVAFAGDRLREACDGDPTMGYALMKRLLELVTEQLDATRMRRASREQPQPASA